MIDEPRVYWDIAQRISNDYRYYNFDGETEWVHEDDIPKWVQGFNIPNDSEVYIIRGAHDVGLGTWADIMNDFDGYFIKFT